MSQFPPTDHLSSAAISTASTRGRNPDMGMPAALIATARVHPGCGDAFTEWNAHHLMAVSRFPGFLSSDLIPAPAGNPGAAWTIILNFASAETLEGWRRSPWRGRILGEAMPLLDGGSFDESVGLDSSATPRADVTEVIFARVRHGMEDRYREWAARMQAAQAKYSGYRGMYLQPAADKGGHWTSVLRYATAGHLEAWMNGPERKALLAESDEFIKSEEFMRLRTSFPGWVPVNPATGKGPPNWKTALLVLVGLFPIVMLEIRFLSPVFKVLGIHASLGTFLGNVISVALTSFATMPCLVKWFGWWLFPKKNTARITMCGLSILFVVFTLEVVFLWELLPW